MNKLPLKVAMTAAAVGLLSSSVAVAQVLAPAKRAERVQITRAPVVESARDHLTIVRWTVNNPGGLDDHFGVVHYGKDPNHLDETAANHIRLNRDHQETVFRVRLTGLAPSTTYYYRVASVDSNGASDGVESAILQFATPAADDRVE
jgi:phosphodiesterase/alkaline phosphatase D-like protein